MAEFKPEIAIVVAVDQKNGIGKNGVVPWYIPNDLKHFREVTIPHPVIVGRTTYNSFPEKYRPLPKRENIVLSRDPNLVIPGVRIAHSLEEAFQIASNLDNERICVIGGEQIYKEALSLADVLYLTRIEGDFHADTFFPPFEDQFPHVLRSESLSYEGLNYRFEDRVRSILATTSIK